MSGEGLFPTPLPDGRRLYARSLFYREGVLRRAPWILPGAPDAEWFAMMTQMASFLKKRHVDHVTTSVPHPHFTVYYTNEWRTMGDADAHEYQLMRPEQAKADNERP